MVLEFSGGEKVLYQCRVQLEPTALKFSEINLYVTQTRLVFELERPLSVELSEMMDMSLERFYGEQFIHIRYKDLSGVNTLTFVCTGFGGIISNISRTIFVYKLISRLRGGMDPRDIRFIISGSTIELYLPWILLTLMIVAPAISVLFPLDCISRLAVGVILVLAFTAFSLTEVYKLLFGRLRWSISFIVLFILLTSLAVIWNNCSTVEVEHNAKVTSKAVLGDLSKPETLWYCVNVQSDVREERLCVARGDWETLKVGDKIVVYYLEGPVLTTMVPYKYDDRLPSFVLRNRY